MSIGDAAVLASWSNFYVIVGSSAGAMTGLMFIVITLVAQLEVARATPDGVETYTTPTVVHLCLSLFGSLVLSAPWRSLGHPAAILALAGLFGLGYVARVGLRMRNRVKYVPVLDDWVWYVILPGVSYLTIVGAAVGMSGAPGGALLTLAGALVLLIFIGIHNAWDIVTVIALGRYGGQAAPTAKPSDPPATGETG